MALKTKKQEAQQPLILRAHRLMEAFAKSDDERDFYLDRQEGFIIYVDLDKAKEDLDKLEEEISNNPDRYCMIPKLTFYEAKKIMEGFVNEKVYDIDTKEKLLDIIQAKEARSNFLEFIYDHHSEWEKWQQYYQERSRIRIIEWLRQFHFHFVFEEDLELARNLTEKLKQSLFETKVGKDVMSARKILISKAKSYYSNEALNPRPKRGRPPKQAVKQEVEPQVTSDIYTTVPSTARPFLFIPDISSSSGVTFSADFENANQLASRRQTNGYEVDTTLASLQQKLASLRELSSRWVQNEKEDVEEEEEEEEDWGDEEPKMEKKKKSAPATKPGKEKTKAKATVEKKGSPGRKQKHKRIIPVQKNVVKTKSSKPADTKKVAKASNSKTATKSRLARLTPQKKGVSKKKK